MDELDEDLFSTGGEHDDDLDDLLAPGCEVRLHLPGIDGLVLSLDTRTGEATGVVTSPVGFGSVAVLQETDDL